MSEQSLTSTTVFFQWRPSVPTHRCFPWSMKSAMPVSQTGAMLLLQLISRRYEHA